MRWFTCIVCLFLLPASSALAQPRAAENAPEKDAERFAELLAAARAASQRGEGKATVELLDKAIKLRPKRADLYRWRGREQFQLGNIEASIQDFDRVAMLAPKLEKTLWERGISHYYAGKFDAGARQFELYQTYHDADVENATWRYLCVARRHGVEKARRTLLSIENDRRVPMMQIYDLYRGEATVDEVFAAAKAGEPDKQQLKARLFYAHLYVGLFHEAAGEKDQAKKHIELSAEKYRIGHYMGDVARIHAQLLQQQKRQRD